MAVMDDGLNFNFWATEIKGNGTTTVKLANGDDALHLTMACFGEHVSDDSRTVLICKCNEREAPIAVLLEGSNENQHLDLMISGNTICEFSLRGRNLSSVFLSGFIQPLVDAEDLGAAAAMEVNEEVVRGIQDSADDSNSSMGGLKRQLAAPDRPKKKAKSADATSVLMTEVSKSVLTNADESTEVMADDVEMAEKQEEASEPDAASPTSQLATTSPKKKKNKKKKSKFTYNEIGLGIRTVKKGTGAAVGEGDTVRVRYIGQLASGKKSIFDKNLTDGFTFTIGEGTVIKGLGLGVIGMKQDEKRKILIPSELAYGEEGSGEQIPANSDLLFTMMLLEVL